MATMAGADADALDRAAHELHRAAERLRAARVRVERPLYSSPWHGRGADAFRQEWSASRQAEILAAANFLDGAVATLRRNADEQRRASATGGGKQRSLDGGSGSPTFTWLDDAIDSLSSALSGILLIGDTLEFLKGGGGKAFPILNILYGGVDLFWMDDGYGGEYKNVERLMDIAVIGLGLATLAFPVAAPVFFGIGLGVIAADLFLDSKWGRPFMRGTAQVGRAAWRGAVGATRAVFNGAQSIAERGYSAVRDSAVGAANQAVSTTRRVVGAVSDSAGRAVDAGTRLLTSPFRSGMRLLGG